uniref:Uncharacterized protein n=1 Tax=Pristionchus pacificus TaxID=54126 RepID=A0A2A6BTZ2_PRIPA|eukprot:PDM69273.1 hypothetical protein PRIPAC_47575 [Pristionchus pacificus]
MENLLYSLSTASFAQEIEQNDDDSSEKNDRESDDQYELQANGVVSGSIEVVEVDVEVCTFGSAEKQWFPYASSSEYVTPSSVIVSVAASVVVFLRDCLSKKTSYNIREASFGATRCHYPPGSAVHSPEHGSSIGVAAE